MKLPGKSTSYKNSVIALFPAILRLLEKNDMPVSELYRAISAEYSDFVSALDCLYALGKIDITERRLLHYAD